MKLEHKIGDTVYTIVKTSNGWGVLEAIIDKITITQRHKNRNAGGISYHLKNNSSVGGSYIYYRKPNLTGDYKILFKSLDDAKLFIEKIGA